MSSTNPLLSTRIDCMANAYDAKSQSVGEFLGSSASRTKILVPEFQRGYMWGKDQIEAFWTDVTKNMEARAGAPSTPKHFFGPIVTLPDAEITDHIHLLDGQQRLATTIILLSVIRDKAREIGKSENVGNEFAGTTQQFIAKEDGGFNLELGETDQRFFRDFIQSISASKTKATIKTHRNIVNSRARLYGHLKKYLDGKSNVESLVVLKNLRTAVLYDLVFANIEVTTEDSAFNIFETLNDRGLKLSSADLLLNHLMGKAREHDRKEIRALFKASSNTLNGTGGTICSLPFLSSNSSGFSFCLTTE